LDAVEKAFAKTCDLRIDREARIAVARKLGTEPERIGRKVGVITAGTTDIGVAEEARTVADAMGCDVVTAYDIGIAGFHRHIGPLKAMLQEGVDAIIVVAGMEGALPSVIASLAHVPIIGVPTSTGYGFGGGGTGALTTMLQSCSLGLCVVNIDNGVGGGAYAALIARRVAAARGDETQS
jgi:NCAIR mutase (PurE)-related protein